MQADNKIKMFILFVKKKKNIVIYLIFMILLDLLQKNKFKIIINEKICFNIFFF